MAPIALRDRLARTTLLASRAALAAGPTVMLSRRDISVNSTQKVTLGVIVAYVVAIALLWNIPYVRNVLWPFKVSTPPAAQKA